MQEFDYCSTGVGTTATSLECGGSVHLCARVRAVADAGEAMGPDRLLFAAFDSELGGFRMVTGGSPLGRTEECEHIDQ